MSDFQHVRLIEALLFAASEPQTEAQLAARLPNGVDLKEVLSELEAIYATRGVNLVRRGAGWVFRTAPDLASLLAQGDEVAKKLSRAAIETLAIIAYHQPVTRAEIEEIRGVSLGKGTLDVLFEAGWVRPKGRRQTPGRPILWATTDGFLDHFGLTGIGDLPRLEELRASGLLESQIAAPTAVEDPQEPAAALDEAELEERALEQFGSDEG
jgi:segregation and condensation protein B